MRDVLLTAHRFVVAAVDVASDRRGGCRRGQSAHGFAFSAVLCPGQHPLRAFVRKPSGAPSCGGFSRFIASVHWLHLFQLGEGGHAATRQRPDERELGIIPRRFSPRFDGTAGDAPDIISRLARQLAVMINPLADAVGAGIVGRGGQPEIAKMLAQRVQKARRCRYRLAWIERIGQAGLDRGARHELGNAQCAGPAHGIALQLALLPNQIGEKRHRQIVILCRCQQRCAKTINGFANIVVDGVCVGVGQRFCHCNGRRSAGRTASSVWS